MELETAHPTAEVPAPEPQNPIFNGLRAVVAKVDELMSCENTDTLYRRAVEFCREELGLERCAIYVEKDSYLQGTYGTDRHGRTVGEHAHRLPLGTAMHAGYTWEAWRERLRVLRPQDRHWVVSEVEHCEWDGEKIVTIGKGWVAVTLVQTPGGEFAVLFNDTAISGAPFDEAKQEIVAIFCSLLGSIRKGRPPQHLYQKIAEKIRSDILSNRYTDKIPGERELAQEYTANIKTINKAVSQLTDEGWLCRLKGRGTFVNHAPKVVKPKTNTVGLLAPSLLHPTVAGVTQALKELARLKRMPLPVETIGDPKEDVPLALQSLQDQEAECVIVWASLLDDGPLRDLLARTRLRVVVFGAPEDDCDAVWFDTRAAARRLTAHLLATVGTPLAFLGTGQKDDAKFLGYRDALRAMGVPNESRWRIETEETAHDAYRSVRELLEADERPHGLLFSSETVAAGGERAVAQASGTRVVSVGLATFLETTDASQLLAPISTASPPYTEAAAKLFELIERRLQSPNASLTNTAVEYDVRLK